MTTIRDFTITRFSFRRDRIIGDSQVRADSCYAAALELHTDDGRTGLGFMLHLFHPLPDRSELERTLRTGSARRSTRRCGTSLGCDPTRKSTVAVKSNHHFRAAFEPIGREVITVNGGGLGSVILSQGEYKKVRRPIWPLDKMA